jgi:hypothetical protein
MNRKKILMLTLIVILCVSSSASLLFAEIQRISGAEDALAGLTTIHPRLQYYEDGALQESNPDKVQLQSDLERMLTDTGIKLVGMDEFQRLVASRSYPIALLDMEVRMSKIPDTELKAYILSIKLRQAVFLARKPVVRFLASSWESADFGVAKDFAFVSSVAKDALARFVQDLQAQNPK